MFEKASRMKLRFNYKGICTIEDLWDMPLKALDSIFKDLNAQMKTAKEESLLETKTKEDEELDLSIDIIKHVVSVRLAEKEERENKIAKAEKKHKLLSILAEKQDENLRNKSEGELKKLIEEL